MTAIEERFSITLEHAEILQMTSIANIAAVLQSKGVALDASS